jgi:hypothetical protein
MGHPEVFLMQYYRPKPLPRSWLKSPRPLALVLLAILVFVRAGSGLAVHPSERRGSFGAFLLVLVLLRLLLFPVASYLTFRHGDPPILDG